MGVKMGKLEIALKEAMEKAPECTLMIVTDEYVLEIDHRLINVVKNATGGVLWISDEPNYHVSDRLNLQRTIKMTEDYQAVIDNNLISIHYLTDEVKRIMIEEKISRQKIKRIFRKKTDYSVLGKRYKKDIVSRKWTRGVK